MCLILVSNALFEVFLEKKYKDFLTANHWCLFVSNDKPALTVTNKSDAKFFKYLKNQSFSTSMSLLSVYTIKTKI